MDAFREFQKAECLDGSPNKRDPYGCQCCRRFPNLNKFKKWSRRRARHLLKNMDKAAKEEKA